RKLTAGEKGDMRFLRGTFARFAAFFTLFSALSGYMMFADHKNANAEKWHADEVRAGTKSNLRSQIYNQIPPVIWEHDDTKQFVDYLVDEVAERVEGIPSGIKGLVISSDEIAPSEHEEEQEDDGTVPILPVSINVTAARDIAELESRMNEQEDDKKSKAML